MGKCKIQAAAGSDMSIANGKIVRGFAETGSIKYHTFISQAIGASGNRVLPNDNYAAVVPATETSWLAITQSSDDFYVSVLTLNKATGTVTAGTKVLLRYGDYNSIKNLWRVSDNTFVCIFDPMRNSKSYIYVYKLIISGNTVTVSTFELGNAQSSSSDTVVVACLIDSTHVMAVVSDYYIDRYDDDSFTIAASVVDIETMTLKSRTTVLQSDSYRSEYGYATKLAQYKSNKFCALIYKKETRNGLEYHYNVELELSTSYTLTVKSTSAGSTNTGEFGNLPMGRCWLVEEGYWANFTADGRLELYSGDDTQLNNTAIQTITAPASTFREVYRTPGGRTILVIDSNIYEYVFGANKKFTQVLLGTSTQNFGSPFNYSFGFDTWITDELKLFIVNSSRQYWLDTVERLTSLLFREATSSSGITGISKDNLKENELGKVWVLNE